MNSQDMNKGHVAAADLESTEFERDHVTLELQEAVGAAAGLGEDLAQVARAADMSAGQVLGAQQNNSPPAVDNPEPEPGRLRRRL